MKTTLKSIQIHLDNYQHSKNQIKLSEQSFVSFIYILFAISLVIGGIAYALNPSVLPIQESVKSSGILPLGL